jgi:hypothetical protein
VHERLVRVELHGVAEILDRALRIAVDQPRGGAVGEVGAGLRRQLDRVVEVADRLGVAPSASQTRRGRSTPRRRAHSA